MSSARGQWFCATSCWCLGAGRSSRPPTPRNRSGPQGRPAAILIVGVNGAGKTTTVGKLAYKYGKEGAKVRQGGALRVAAGARKLVAAEFFLTSG